MYLKYLLFLATLFYIRTDSDDEDLDNSDENALNLDELDAQDELSGSGLAESEDGDDEDDD